MLPPLPNLFFTRDSCMVAGEHVLVGSMRYAIRWTEAIIMKALFSHHPEDGADWPVPVIVTRRLKGRLDAPPAADARYSLYEIFVDGRDGGPGETFPLNWLSETGALGRFFIAGD